MFSYVSDKSVDMIVCDLPYGVTKNSWDKVLPFDRLWKEYKRIIKDNGVIALFGQGKFFADIINSNRSWFRYDLVWDKILVSGFLNANRMPLRRHEQIAIFYKRLPKYKPQFWEGKPIHDSGNFDNHKREINRNYGKFNRIRPHSAGRTEHYPTSILQIKKLHPSLINHPTEKPIELLEYLIKTYTDESETVLDNCMGVGSTIAACIKTNRHYIGFEIMPEYYELAERRIESLKQEINECRQNINTVACVSRPQLK